MGGQLADSDQLLDVNAELEGFPKDPSHDFTLVFGTNGKGRGYEVSQLYESGEPRKYEYEYCRC